MKKIKKLLLTALFLSSLFLNSCKNDGLTNITVAEVTHSLFYAPQYIAINKGYFKDEGLNVNVITTPGADKTMAALLSKEAQIGLMGPEATVYVYNGGEKNYAVNFAQLTQKDGSFLLGREKIDNFTYDMLKGKTLIGGRKGGMPEMTLEYVLKNQGLTVTRNGEDLNADVNIRTDVNFDVMAGVFTAGQSDYVTLFEPSASQVERNGIGHIVTSIGESSGVVPYTCYSSLKDYLSDNSETINKFTRAIKKGLEFVYSASMDELVEALSPSFVSSDNEEITRVMTNYLNIQAWPTSLELKEENYNRLIEIVTMAGELDKPAPFEKIVNNTFSK
ncbi:MAG: ABC transporter substrate-binding protein [Erysipelotrichaceae bacterium]|nr:ABC transporter substrate-binding protein [Erysipelotrichaceae bacterium]